MLTVCFHVSWCFLLLLTPPWRQLCCSSLSGRSDAQTLLLLHIKQWTCFCLISDVVLIISSQKFGNMQCVLCWWWSGCLRDSVVDSKTAWKQFQLQSICKFKAVCVNLHERFHIVNQKWFIAEVTWGRCCRIWCTAAAAAAVWTNCPFNHVSSVARSNRFWATVHD